ncbi:MAG: 6-phosphofructokinase [Gemmataceae bacterium]|nr:6-phosphofructokinase [Gemmataceae bacterium]
MANSTSRRKLAIVVGGGPAPGINGVISSVTIEAINQGFEVFGVRDGFKYLVAGINPDDPTQVRHLTIPDVAPHYQRGGSILGTSRTNPTKKDEDMKMVLAGLEKLGTEYLVTIGGDDTAFSGSQVYARAGGKIRVAHVPKTIDNDLPLPPGIPTFGFETARHIGVELARNIKEDARTTTRWYILVSMGRAAGHLALGIGKASAATVTVIAEELRGKKVNLDLIADLIIGSMIKRKAQGKGYGVVVLAEGLLEAIGADALKADLGDRMNMYGTIEEDDFGHLRLGEIEFGRMIRHRVAQRLEDISEAARVKAGKTAKEWKNPLKSTMIDKDLGYELRCADPVPFDAEYTRNLGYGAVKFLMSEEADRVGAVISFVGEKLVPRPFQEMIDPKTKKMRPRLVDVESQSFECARRYMIRLEPGDFTKPESLGKLADAARMTPEEFRTRFEYLVR